MWIALIVIGGVVVLFGAIVLVSRVAMNAMRGPLEARVTRRYPTGVVASDFGANSFGLTSLGKFQARGNGALVLTATELTFFQLVPEREIVIPLSSILELSLTRSHLGKATPFKLLKISFRGEAGEDSIAVFLRRPAPFLAEIEGKRSAVATVGAS